VGAARGGTDRPGPGRAIFPTRARRGAVGVNGRGGFSALAPGGMRTGRWIWEPGTATAAADDAAFAARAAADGCAPSVAARGVLRLRIQLTEILVLARVFLACCLYTVLVRT